jgi:hypothetical protein
MILVLGLVSVPFSYEGTLRAGQTLTVRDVNGSVRVRNGDRLLIQARKYARTGDPNAVKIHVEQHPDGTIVCVRYPPDAERSCSDNNVSSHGGANNDTAVDFEVTIPRGVELDAETVNGSVDAQTDGLADAATVNGSLRVDAREIRSARTINGSIGLRVRNGAHGALEAKAVNGSIDVEVPPGSGVTLDAKTLTGSIHAAGVAVDKPRFGPGANAHATLGDGAHHLDLETVNGSITLRR